MAIQIAQNTKDFSLACACCFGYIANKRPSQKTSRVENTICPLCGLEEEYNLHLFY